MKRILVPLPTYGFDPTEAAVPWQVLAAQGFQMVFATPDGRPGAADERMVRGTNLGIWKPVLQARADAVAAYRAMEQAAAFRQPLAYAQANVADFDALLLPGGHDKGMREYLESPLVQALVTDFFAAGKPLGAICHGVLAAARSRDAATGRSVLHGYRTTALLHSQELAAYRLTRLWLGDYYLTYPATTVEDEVKAALAEAGQFRAGPSPLRRDDPQHLGRGFVVQDRNYLSAHWPGDAYSFARAFAALLNA